MGIPAHQQTASLHNTKDLINFSRRCGGLERSVTHPTAVLLIFQAA
ncbi:MAG: hypothetical protein IKH45_03425 [Neisseriaceae bacterium]|nr:hypothetical protein [Neisseriaceae bacterium]